MAISAVGAAHTAVADAVGAAIILFDKDGIWSKRANGLCLRFAETVQAMKAKMAEPLVAHEPVSDFWQEYKDGDAPPTGDVPMPPHMPQRSQRKQPPPRHCLHRHHSMPRWPHEHAAPWSAACCAASSAHGPVATRPP